MSEDKNSPYDDGYHDGYHDIPSDNPYSPGTDDYDEWERGYEDGHWNG